MKKNKWLVIIGIICLGCIGGWYLYNMQTRMPVELEAAEKTLKGLMKAPDTFKIKSAIFDVTKGSPAMLIEYVASNSLGVPLRGYAKFVYSCGIDSEESLNNDEAKLKIRQLKMQEYEEINRGDLKIAPFDYCKLERIEMDEKIDNERQDLLKLQYMVNIHSIKEDKKFIPRSKIGGQVIAVDNNTGKIEKVFPPLFIKTYTPGEFLPWEN